MTTEPAAATVSAEEIARLEDMARRIRVAVVRTVKRVRVGHVGGPLSAAEVLAALYGRILRVRPAEPGWPERDRFILSKGHSSLGQYAAMGPGGRHQLRQYWERGRDRVIGIRGAWGELSPAWSLPPFEDSPIGLDRVTRWLLGVAAGGVVLLGALWILFRWILRQGPLS